MIDNTVLISGAPMRFGGILFRQPTLGQIYRDPDVGKAVYDSYLYLVSLDVEGFLQATGLTDIYMGLPRDIREQIGIFDPSDGGTELEIALSGRSLIFHRLLRPV